MLELFQVSDDTSVHGLLGREWHLWEQDMVERIAALRAEVELLALRYKRLESCDPG